MATDIGPRIGLQGEQEFRKSIQAVNAQIKALGAEMESVTARFGDNAKSEEALAAKNEALGKSITATQQKMSLLDSQMETQKKKLAELAEALDKAAAEFGEDSKAATKAQNAYNAQYAVVAKLETQYNQAAASVAKMESAMNDVGDAAGDATEQLDVSAVFAGNAGWDMVKSAVNAAEEALKDCLQTGMAFDAAMSQVAATLGVSTDSIAGLTEFAKEMGATTAFTAGQAAEALNYMALAGYDAEQSMEALPNVLNLAAAGSMSLASASDMVTDAQSALNLSMAESERLVDQMAMTSSKTNTSVEQLGNAILTVGGTANYLAGGTTELNQVLGVLADNSIKGTEGGTKLRNIILALATPTTDAAKVLDKLGVSVFDAEGNMRSFTDIFPELNRAMSELTDAERVEALSTIFNSRDLAAAQALLGTTAERWDELAVSIDGAQGAAQRMAETQLDNLAGDLTLLESAADGVKIAVSDGLTPALRDAAQAGTGLLGWLGSFLSETPGAVQVAAGLTAGIATLTVGVGAYTAATTFGTAAITAFNAAMTATPVGVVALLVGGAVAAFTALSAAAADATDAHRELLDSLEESRTAYEETSAAIQTGSGEINNMLSALETLAAEENKSAVQKAAMLDLVEQLNAAIPDLNLAYDAQTDSLNMNAAALRDVAQAQIDAQAREAAVARMTELLQEQATISDALADAQARQAQAELELAAAEERVAAGEYAGVMWDYYNAVESTGGEVETLTQALEANEAEMEALEDAYGDGETAAQKHRNAVEDSTGAMEDSAAAAAELAQRQEELTESTSDLSDEVSMLKKALDEQAKSGSLSLDTALKLIDSGYAAAVAVDQETGAVTLNREAYLQIAQAKLDAQLATLEAEKASVDAALANAREAQSAVAAAEGYMAKAKAVRAAQAAEDGMDLSALESQSKAYEAQIAALRSLRSELGSYTGAVTTSSRKSASAAKKSTETVKSEAEQALATFKDLKSQLDHEKAMDLISEEDYYRKLGELRDAYLTDSSNLSEYQKISEQIHKYETGMLEQQQKDLEKAAEEREKALEQFAKSVDKIESNINKLEENYQKQLDSRAQAIYNSFGLFEEIPERQAVAGAELMENLRGQIAMMDEFYSNLEELEARGVGSGLVDEIRGMGTGAADQLAALLNMTDGQLEEYAGLFQEKQELANEVALKELESLRAETDAQIQEQLDELEQLYTDSAPDVGLAFTGGLSQGILSGMSDVTSAAISVAQSALAAVRDELGIHSPSTVAAEMGGYFDEGFRVGINAGAPAVRRDVEAMMDFSGLEAQQAEFGSLAAGMVNGMQTAMTGTGTDSATIILKAGNDVEIARWFLPSLRAVMRADPEVVSGV